jgi:hypothetical protein
MQFPGVAASTCRHTDAYTIGNLRLYEMPISFGENAWTASASSDFAVLPYNRPNRLVGKVHPSHIRGGIRTLALRNMPPNDLLGIPLFRSASVSPRTNGLEADLRAKRTFC